MLNVKSVDEVLKLIYDNFSDYPLENCHVCLKDAIDRVLSEDIISGENIPGFNRSSVDGYAVISSDTFGASEALPAQLIYAGEVKMGEKTSKPLEKGQAVYVPTGGELPENADAVVMIEYTENYNDGFIYVNKPAAPGNNVVFAGDDVKEKDVVLKAGTCLRPQDIGVLAALGISAVKVKKRIKVGIIATGDEVVDINEKTDGARVRDVNSYTLYAGLLKLGCEPLMYGIVNDDYDGIRNMVSKALNECDIVLISGGSSVGAKDETCRVINSLGKPGIIVHGIAVKPGKPTIIGKINGKAVVGLPGHPASAYVIFNIFVRKLVEVIYKVRHDYPKIIKARMACNYPSNNGREEFLPVRIEETLHGFTAHPIFGKSGLITLLAQADGYIHISRGVEGLSANQEVEVLII